MNKKLLLLFLIVLVGLCAVSNASAVDGSDLIAMDNETQVIEEVPEGNVYNINPDTSIQDTINNANPGDTIVLNGTFELKNAIDIDKKIKIVGEGNGATIKPNPTNFNNIRFFNIKTEASSVVLSNLKIIHGHENTAGAILWEGSAGSINNCEFIDNIAENTYGGAIVLKGSNCNVSDCTFRNNQASQGGGAILIGADNCQIINCTFNQNLASKCGGAIQAESNNCLVTNCTFNINRAAYYGGAIALNGKKNTVSNSLFKGNYINVDNTTMSGGGAIFSSCDGEIENCNFTENNARNSNGGAIYLIEKNYILNSSFLDNSARFGNDVYGNSSSFIDSNYFVIQYNESEENSVNITVKYYGENTFHKIKALSSVDFSASMIFEYGAVGSISVLVDGGYVKKENIRVLNHKEAVISFKNNILKVSGLNVGTYTLRVTTTPDENHTSVDEDLKITVKKANAVISASKLTVALNSAAVWSIKIINSKTNKPISGLKLSLKVYTGSKYKTVSVKTNSKGIATYKTKGLSAGNHKIVVSISSKQYTFKTLTSSVKVIKQTPLKFKLKSRVSDKDGAVLSYMVSNKKTGKGVNGIKIKVLIYTGKKYKTYILKTKKIKGKKKTYNGAVGFATNEFSAGTHKVVFKPYDLKYKGSATSSIVIKKSATKGLKFFRNI